jgi:predicted Zn-dependent protease
MFDFYPQLKQCFAALRTRAEFFSLRYVRESGQYLSVRKNVAEPPYFSQDQGRHAHRARVNGVEAYAATMTMTPGRFASSARTCRTTSPADRQPRPARPDAGAGVQRVADYCSPDLDQAFPSLSDCYALLGAESAAVPKDERLVSWDVSLGLTHVEQIYLNSAGAEVRQAQRFVFPGMSVTAYDGHDSQTRTWAARTLASRAAPM